jgi:hypothetical protein
MDYAEELRFKLRRVEDALARIGGLDVSVAGIVGAESTENYRNKAIYAVGKREGRAVTGFYRERSHEIVPTETCLIQAEVADRAASAVRRWMDRFAISAYSEEFKSGTVRHIFCRYAFTSKKAQVTIVSNDQQLPHAQALVDELRKYCPEVAGIVLNINKTRGNTVLAGEFVTLWGEDFITDELCGLSFKLSPRSFYQINSAQAEKLYDKAIDYAALDGTQTVFGPVLRHGHHHADHGGQSIERHRRGVRRSRRGRRALERFDERRSKRRIHLCRCWDRHGRLDGARYTPRRRRRRSPAKRARARHHRNDRRALPRPRRLRLVRPRNARPGSEALRRPGLQNDGSHGVRHVPPLRARGNGGEAVKGKKLSRRHFCGFEG